MMRTTITILLLTIGFTSFGQNKGSLKAIFNPIPIEFEQKDLIDSIIPYLTDFDNNESRFKLIKHPFFKNYDEVFVSFLDHREYFISDKELKQKKIQWICLDIKLGAIEADDKKGKRKFNQIYHHYCEMFNNYEAEKYELLGDLKFADGTNYFFDKEKSKPIITIELYEVGGGTDVIWVEEDGKTYEAYNIRFKYKLNTTKAKFHGR